MYTCTCPGGPGGGPLGGPLGSRRYTNGFGFHLRSYKST